MRPTDPFDPDYAYGKRKPDLIPHASAARSLTEIDLRAIGLVTCVNAILLDGPEKIACVMSLDKAICYAKELVLRYDRNGPLVGQSELEDVRAALRQAKKYPDQFKFPDASALARREKELEKKGSNVAL